MAGIFGFYKDTESQSNIDDMLGILDVPVGIHRLHTFCDDNVSVVNLGLKHHKYNNLSDTDIEVLVAGTCYNLDAFSESNFPRLLANAYRNDRLAETLKQVDGCFHCCLYDKKNHKIIIATDRFGLHPLFVYSKNKSFAFGAEPKAMLGLDFVDNSIDNAAFAVFEKLGYLLWDSTWFQYIKRVKPATIISFDIAKKQVSSSYYWTFAEIQKSNISFEVAVDTAYRLFQESIRKQFNPSIQTIIPVSAGYDSRLILATVKEVYPDCNPDTTTFGVKNCLDILTARRVCRLARIKKHYENYFANIDWLGHREKLVYNCDCSFSLQHMHGLEFISTFQNISCLMNGYLGDTVFGCSYLPQDNKLFNCVINKKVAKHYFGDFYEYCGFDEDYFKISNPIVLLWFNRGNNFINEAQRLCYNNFDVSHPFFDNKIIEFIASLPNEYLQGDRLYNALVLKYYPKYFKFIGRNGNRPAYLKKGLAYRYNKMKFALDKLLRTIRIKPRIVMAYANYTKWVQEHPNKERLMQLLNRDTSFYSKYTDTDYL